MRSVVTDWVLKHRVVAFAAGLTLAIGAALLTGALKLPQAILPLTVSWALAFHAIDFRHLVERLEAANEIGRKAESELKAGDLSSAVQDGASALQQVIVAAEEVKVEVKGA